MKLEISMTWTYHQIILFFLEVAGKVYKVDLFADKGQLANVMKTNVFIKRTVQSCHHHQVRVLRKINISKERKEAKL